jgi:hypothetical protein
VSTRQPAVAGQFYPGTAERLRAELDRCLGPLQPAAAATGIVVPHAGYVYSGRTAGAVYARVAVPGRVAVLSPNHTGRGEPVAVWAQGEWLTPLGPVAVDSGLAAALLAACPAARADEVAHLGEHSLEVQLPFIQKRNPAARALPVTLGTQRPETLEALGRGLAAAIRGCGEPVLIVASSDMTHFEPAERARAQDDLAIARMRALDPEGLLATVRKHSISMCGVAPVAAMLWAAKALGARGCEMVDYSHSGMVTGDDSDVVGYAGLVVR